MMKSDPTLKKKIRQNVESILGRMTPPRNGNIGGYILSLSELEKLFADHKKQLLDLSAGSVDDAASLLQTATGQVVLDAFMKCDDLDNVDAFHAFKNDFPITMNVIKKKLDISCKDPFWYLPLGVINNSWENLENFYEECFCQLDRLDKDARLKLEGCTFEGKTVFPRTFEDHTVLVDVVDRMSRMREAEEKIKLLKEKTYNMNRERYAKLSKDIERVIERGVDLRNYFKTCRNWLRKKEMEKEKEKEENVWEDESEEEEKEEEEEEDEDFSRLFVVGPRLFAVGFEKCHNHFVQMMRMEEFLQEITNHLRMMMTIIEKAEKENARRILRSDNFFDYENGYPCPYKNCGEMNRRHKGNCVNCREQLILCFPDRIRLDEPEQNIVDAYHHTIPE